MARSLSDGGVLSDVIFPQAVSHVEGGAVHVELGVVGRLQPALGLLLLEAGRALGLPVLVQEAGYRCQHAQAAEDHRRHHA